MRLSIKHILLIFLIFILSQIKLVSASSNVKNLLLEQLSVKDGLPQGSVNSILADKTGFVWLATDNGVNIYDGYSFKQLKGPDNSFIDTHVYFVKQDSLGFVWLNVGEGLYRYQPRTNQYQLILANDDNDFVVDVLEGKNSHDELGFWLAKNKTISFYHPDKAELQVEVNLSSELPAKGNIFQIKHHQQTLYIGTRFGVYAYHIKLNKWKKLPSVSSDTILSDINFAEANKIFTLHVSHNARLYTGTGDGVFSLDIGNIKDYIQGQADAKEYNQVFEKLSVWQFLLSEDQLYVTSNKGLHVIDTLKHQSKFLFGLGDYSTDMSNNEIISIAKSNSGVFWFGTRTSGVYLWDPTRDLIENYRYMKNMPNSLSDNAVWAIESEQYGPQDKNQNIWVGTGNGLNYIDLEKGTVEQRTDFEIYSVFSYQKNRLLLYTPQGFFFFNELLNQAFRLSFNEKTMAILSKEHHSIFLQDKRYLWLVYDEAVSVIDLKTGQIDGLSELGNIVPPKEIYSFMGMLPSSHTMLFTTNDSLWGYDIVTKEAKRLYQHPDAPISKWISFDNWVIDKNNILWLSYPTKGLVGLEFPSFKPKYFYHSDNSIIDNNVYSLLTDDEGDVWFSSHKGLFLLDTDNQHIRNFTTADGLTAMELNAGAQIKLSNGNLAYGSMEGVSVFQPRNLKNKYQNEQINIYITAVDVISRQLDLPLLLNQDEDILLHYDDVGIRFDFSTLSYLDRREAIYEYQLTGDSKVRYPPTTENRITFPNLSSGSYVLSVRAKSPISGEYSVTKQIKIRVSYAPWKSPLAYTIYGLLLFSLIFIWLQRRNEQKQKLLSAHEEVKFRENRLQLALKGSNSEVWDWQGKQNLMFGKRISQDLSYVDLAVAYTFEQHLELIHPDDKENFLSQWRLFLDKSNLEETFSSTYRLKHVDGHWLWYKDLGKIVSLDKRNKPSRITGSYTNITQTRADEVRSQYYGEAFKQTNDWVLIVNSSFTRITANESLRSIFALSEEEFTVDENFLGFNKRRLKFFADLLPTLNEGDHWRGEELVTTNSGEEFNVILNINVGRNKASNKLHYICVFTDISAQKSAEKELRYLANYDNLTDLPNRGLLLDRIKHAMETSQRQKKPIALFFIDLDKFKHVNDSLGHDCGDLLLVEVSRRLSKLLRIDDTVARIGGDEFVVLLESFQDTAYLGLIAQKIITAIEEPVSLQGNQVSIGASIGIALYPEDAEGSNELLRHADIAMYHAKQLGRNTFQFFTPTMNVEATERLTKESNMKLAYNNNEFINYYQPIIDARTGKAAGFELLMRWQNKQGVVAPAEFIHTAEELGLIIPMTEAALERGLIDLKRWHKARPTIYLSVNLSPKHFAQESLVPYISKLLKKHGLPANLLKIEVTESALLSEPEKSIKTMNSLSELGVILALDDFGTGFSSMSYLKRLPLDIIKIDRSFVSGICIEKTDEAIVDATLVLAKRLNMHCIAEGVETREQLDYLTTRECYYIQGYLYSKPLDTQTLNDFLNANITELKAMQF